MELSWWGMESNKSKRLRCEATLGAGYSWGHSWRLLRGSFVGGMHSVTSRRILGGLQRRL